MSHAAHDHAHDQDEAPTEQFTSEFWDARYSGADRVWSGQPNPQLVAEVADLTPGTALDVGSGEGADAVWLATRGWTVTGVDVSPIALGRAAAHAVDAGTTPDGATVASRTAWQQADLRTWEPPTAAFDLVSAQFMYLPADEIGRLHEALAAAVRPGGTLLVVGHHPDDLETTIGRPKAHGDMLYTAADVAARLDPEAWDVVVSEARPRQAVDPEGRTVTIKDAVLRAVRR